MISFIVPAHNEEAWIGRCLAAIRIAMEGIPEAYEVLVADDASTDLTPSLAEKHGARVIRVAHRQISAARNAGARQARGDTLFFVDADTLVNAHVMQLALRALRENAVGGGCVPRFEGRLPLWWKAVYPLFVVGVRLLRQPGGLVCSAFGELSMLRAGSARPILRLRTPSLSRLSSDAAGSLC